MGICGSNERKKIPSKKELKYIKVVNNDFSFIFTILQALNNLSSFKNFIVNYKLKEDEKLLSLYLQKIFKNDVNNKLIYNSKLIQYIIIKRFYYIEDNPGKLIFQILELLRQEHKNKKLPIDIKNNQNINNNEIIAFNNFISEYSKENFNNQIAELFHFFIQKRIMFNNNIINYSYNFKCIFEFNLLDIFNSGKCSLNMQTQLPMINLFECISATLSPKFTNFNNMQCMEQEFLYSTSSYLIFIMNRRGENNNYYCGHFLYNDTINLSQFIVRDDNKNEYILTSIIKERMNLIQNNSDNGENTIYNYITINRDENGQFYYYEGNLKKNGMFENNEYFEHVLIYKQLK